MMALHRVRFDLDNGARLHARSAIYGLFDISGQRENARCIRSGASSPCFFWSVAWLMTGVYEKLAWMKGLVLRGPVLVD